MRLNLWQDEMMNNAIHNLGMIADGKDNVTGGPLSKQDMQRLAKAAIDLLGILWDQIGQGQPVLGYAPCPWDESHTVGLVPGTASGHYIHCFHRACPMHDVRMSPEDWNRRR